MGTKAELYTLLKDYTTNDEDGFITHIPDFVRASEERIWYFIQVPKFRKTVTGMASADEELLNLPGDFLAIATLWATPNGEFHPIDLKDESYLREVFPDPSVTGLPRVFAQRDDDTVILAPPPDQDYPLNMTYFYKPPSLVDQAEGGTTWLSLHSFEALKFGALMEAAIYMKKQSGVDPMGDEYEKQFMACLTGLKNLGEVRLRKDVNRGGERKGVET